MLKPMIVTITGVSCGGKSSLQAALKNPYVPIVSDTSRNPRNTQDKSTRNIISKEQFLINKETGLYAQAVEMYGNFYGITKEAIIETCEKGCIPICDVCCEGIRQLKSFGQQYSIPVHSIFIFAEPDELKARHLNRNTPLPEMLIRLKAAVNEMEEAWRNIDLFDLMIHNACKEETVSRVQKFLDLGIGTSDRFDPVEFKVRMELIIKGVEHNGNV